MITSRCFRLSSQIYHNGKGRPIIVSNAIRQVVLDRFFTFTANVTVSCLLKSSNTTVLPRDQALLDYRR